jgi:hypothetical protein
MFFPSCAELREFLSGQPSFSKVGTVVEVHIIFPRDFAKVLVVPVKVKILHNYIISNLSQLFHFLPLFVSAG